MKPEKIKAYLDDMRCWYESHDRLNSRGANMNRDALAYIKKLEAVVEAFEARLEALEHDNKESNTWGVRVNGDLQELHNRILRLERKTADTSDYHNLRLQIQDVEKQLEALEQRTKTGEKGVRVNGDLHELHNRILSDIGRKALIKRLGLEE